MKLKSTKNLLLACITAIAGLTSLPASAAFNSSASPPRFELKAKPGEVVRQAVKIINNAQQPARYSVKTADWELDDTGSVRYHEDAPAEGSCRPWVRIERHTVNVGPEAERSYRFEVHIPPEAKSGECRFALLISSEAGSYRPSGAEHIQVPVIGRLGVIVYITIGDATARLDLARLELTRTDGKLVPIATINNKGDAHGRVFGSLAAKDAAGRTFELVVDQGAVLPQSSKAITLTPIDWSSGEARPATFELVPPLHVRGKLQLLGGGEIAIDRVIRAGTPAKPQGRQARK